MIAGSLLAGGMPLDGRLADLRWTPAFGGGALSAVHVGAGAGLYSYKLFVDAALAAVADSPEAGTTALEAGEHDIEMAIQRAGAPMADPAGEVGGRRARLSWAPSDSADTAGYIVESKAPSAADFSEMLRVEELVVRPVVRAAPTVGTGTGRASISGPYIGEPVNGPVLLEIVPTRAWTDDGGTTKRNIQRGAVARGASGATFAFHDDAALYAEGDQWTSWIGPRTDAVTQDLAEPGVWQFRVRAIDRAGNASGPSPVATVFVLDRPEPVEGASIEYDDAEGEAVLFWALPVDPARTAIRLYLNRSNATEQLVEHIIDDEPAEELADDADFWAVPLLPGETLKARIRTANAAGFEDGNLEVLEITPPVASAEIAGPVILSAVPGPSGRAIVRWSYQPLDGDTATNLEVVARADPASASGETVVGETGVLPSLQVVRDYQIETDVLAGTRWLAVRATDIVEHGPFSDWIEVVPDTTAPNAPPSLQAVN